MEARFLPHVGVCLGTGSGGALSPREIKERAVSATAFLSFQTGNQETAHLRALHPRLDPLTGCTALVSELEEESTSPLLSKGSPRVA